MTNTMIKFVIIVSDQHQLSDSELRDCFVKVHAAFVEHIMNPFVPLDRGNHRVIESTRFDAAIEKSVAGLFLKRAAAAAA